MTQATLKSCWRLYTRTLKYFDIQVILYNKVPKFSLWSHHEKSVVIDQSVGYLGGLDLCYGRFDNDNYSIKEPEDSQTTFPGADYNNVRLKDFDVGRNYLKPLVDINKVPRMPWRDIHLRLEGEVIKDLSRNFVQYWSFVKTDYSKSKEARVIGVSNLRKNQEEYKRNNTESPTRNKEVQPASIPIK